MCQGVWGLQNLKLVMVAWIVDSRSVAELAQALSSQVLEEFVVAMGEIVRLIGLLVLG